MTGKEYAGSVAPGELAKARITRPKIVELIAKAFDAGKESEKAPAKKEKKADD